MCHVWLIPRGIDRPTQPHALPRQLCVGITFLLRRRVRVVSAVAAVDEARAALDKWQGRVRFVGRVAVVDNVIGHVREREEGEEKRGREGGREGERERERERETDRQTETVRETERVSIYTRRESEKDRETEIGRHTKTDVSNCAIGTQTGEREKDRERAGRTD